MVTCWMGFPSLRDLTLVNESSLVHIGMVLRTERKIVWNVMRRGLQIHHLGIGGMYYHSTVHTTKYKPNLCTRSSHRWYMLTETESLFVDGVEV